MNLAGVFAPIPTPFDDDERLDLVRLRGALTAWLSTPLSGFVVLGSNGEAALLEEEESDRAIAAARDVVPAGRPLLAGAGRESTLATIRAAQRAAALGVDAVLVRTPGFFKAQMTTDVFVRHYTAVADASPVPVLLYNFTAVTGVNLLPAAATRLSTHPNIIGMKESGGDVAQIADLVSGTPDDFAVLAGSSGTFYSALCVGATGGILALSLVVPHACVELFELVRQQRHEDARALQQRLVPLGRLLGTYGVSGLKAALRMVGYDVGIPRSPLTRLSESGVSALEAALAQFKELVL